MWEGDVVTTEVVTFISSVLIVLWNTVTLVTVPRLLTVTIRPQGPVFGHGEKDFKVVVTCTVFADIKVILDLGFDQRPLISHKWTSSCAVIATMPDHTIIFTGEFRVGEEDRRDHLCFPNGVHNGLHDT